MAVRLSNIQKKVNVLVVREKLANCMAGRDWYLILIGWCFARLRRLHLDYEENSHQAVLKEMKMFQLGSKNYTARTMMLRIGILKVRAHLKIELQIISSAGVFEEGSRETGTYLIWI